MRRFYYLIIWLLLPAWLSAQTNISAVEYWYDGNYGTANRQTVTGTDVSFTDLLHVNSLEQGLHSATFRFQDDRGVWGSILTKFFTYYPGTSTGIHLITDVEYWFDGDYTTAIETSLTPGTSVDWNSLLNVSSLINGLHTISYRFKDDREIWSAPLIRFFKKENNTGLLQIIAIEYWFNDDYTNKKSSDVAATSLFNFNETLNISPLREGLNFINLRLKDESGKWGPAASWFFIKENEESISELHQITAFEYWYDGDYSTVQTTTVSQNSALNLNAQLNVSGLSNGLHSVSYRFCDEAGEWSSAYSHFFSKFPETPVSDLHEIVAVEYWLDGNYSEKVKETVPVSGSHILGKQLNVSALNKGLHTLSYRFEDENGDWSPAYTNFFSLYSDGTVTFGNKITRYRYWADDLIESAIEVDLATPLKSLNLDEVVDVSSLPGGTHDITFQFRDSLGMWSGAYTDSYGQDFNPHGTITANTNPACSNSAVSFTAETMDVDSIFWDFGDTTAIVGRAASEDAYHAYSNAGTYTVTATLLNVDSAYTNTATTTITVNQSYGVALVAPESLIAHYPLDGNAIDATGNGHDGTVSGATLTEDRNGVPNSAYLFDGNDGILVPHSDELNMAGPLSFSCWIKPTVLQNAMIFGKSNYTSATNYLLRVQSDGNLQWEYNGDLNTTTRPLEADKWYHIVVTADNPGEYRQIYVNGQKVAETTSSSGPFGSITNPFSIGYASRGTEYFKGAIDDLRMYAKTLSAQEIFHLYQLTEGTGLPPVEAEICANDTPYVFGAQLLTESGTYFETYPTINGCDSVVQLNLTVHPTYNDTIGNSSDFQVNDDFESYDVGNLAGWTIKYEGSGVANQKVVDHISKNGVKAFQLEGRSSWAADLYKPIVDAPEKLTIEAWINVTISNALGSGIGLVNYGAASWGARTSRISFENGKIVTGITGGTTYDIQSFTPGEWYHVRIEHDMTARIYSVYINGQKVSGTNGSTTIDVFPMYASAESEDFFLCAGNATTTRVYFDDVKMYVPDDVIKICSSETPYKLGNQDIYTSGTYTETFQSEFGCDSTVTINLTVNPTYEISLAANICEGNSYLFNGKQLSLEGIYKDTLQTINGCDSILVLTLDVTPALETPVEASICEGNSYNFGGEVLFAEGTYKDTLQSVSNCDSIVVLTLNVNPVYEIQIDSAICEGDSVSFAGKTFSTSGIYKDTLQTYLMCDSIMVLNLEVKPVYDDSTFVKICEGDTYNFGGTDYDISGKYVHTFTSALGCDSVVTLQLTVNPKIYKTIDTAICQGNMYAFAGTAISTTGVYKDTLAAASGCDSIVTLNLLVNPIYETPVSANICRGDTYIFGGQTLTTEGVYRDTLISVSNCDSIIVLNLSVDPVYEIPVDTAICEGSTYSFGGNLLTESGVYRDTLQAITSCDSIIILTLTVNDTFRIFDTVTVCENELPYEFGNQTLISDGTYTEQFSSSSGCDSTVILEFSVNDTFNTEYADTICENDLPYLLGEQAINSSGTYSEVFIAENGCDSVVTLHLKVNESYQTNLNVTVNKTDLPYSFGTQEISKTGAYNRSLLTVFGCDSIITLNLKVRDNIPPVVVCNAIAIELEPDGTYTLTATDEDAIIQGTSDDITAGNDLVVKVSPSSFTCENLGETAVEVSVSDAAGNESSCQTTILVTMQALPPKLDDIPDLVINEDDSASAILTGISGGSLCEKRGTTVTAESRNNNLIEELFVTHNLFDSTATLNIHLMPDQNGTDSIFVEVSDSLGAKTTCGFLLTVNPVNDAPTLMQALPDEVMRANDSLNVPINKQNGIIFSDIDDENLFFSFYVEDTAIFDWITAAENDGFYQIIFTPSAADTGCINIVVEASDALGETIADTFRLCVSSIVGINEIERNKFEISLYPNPSRGNVNIDLFNPPPGEIELQITNIAGSEVIRKEYKSNERIIFDLSEHVSGSYLVILKIKDQRIVRKLILDKK